MDDIKEFFLPIFIGVVGIALFIYLLTIGLIVPLQRKTCSQKYLAFENRYDFWKECQIKVNDKWIPADSYYIKESIEE